MICIHKLPRGKVVFVSADLLYCNKFLSILVNSVSKTRSGYTVFVHGILCASQISEFEELLNNLVVDYSYEICKLEKNTKLQRKEGLSNYLLKALFMESFRAKPLMLKCLDKVPYVMFGCLPSSWFSTNPFRVRCAVARFLYPICFLKVVSRLIIVDVDSSFINDSGFYKDIDNSDRLCVFTRKNAWSKCLAGFVLSDVYMGAGPAYLFLQEQIKNIITFNGYFWGIDQVALDRCLTHGVVFELKDGMRFDLSNSEGAGFVSFKGDGKWKI